jgi:hypothetical protein
VCLLALEVALMDATLAELGDVRSVARQIRTREQEREETK